MGIPSLIGKYIWQYKHSNLFSSNTNEILFLHLGHTITFKTLEMSWFPLFVFKIGFYIPSWIFLKILYNISSIQNQAIYLNI